MKHLAVGFIAICAWFGSMLAWYSYMADDRDERIARINAIYADGCVSLPPYSQAMAVRYLEEEGFGGRKRFQLAVKTENGKEEAIFVPAEAVLPLTPRPCNS
jgi:hypothetical protein